MKYPGDSRTTLKNEGNVQGLENLHPMYFWRLSQTATNEALNEFHDRPQGDETKSKIVKK